MKRQRDSKQDIIDCIFGQMDFFLLDDATVVSSGDKIAWKGAYLRLDDNKTGKKIEYPVLIKLLIPQDAVRTHYCNKFFEQYAKHRCSHAKVLGFYSYYTGKELIKYNDKIARSVYNNVPLYEIGSYVRPDMYSWRLSACAHGIHFFWSKTSALLYLDQMCYLNDWKIRKNNM